MAKTRAALIDLSGTIHIGDTVVPGAIEALNRLRNLPNVRVKFVTNTTKESGQFLYDRLTKIGFRISRDEIFTSLTAARQFVDSKKLHPLLLLEDDALKDFEGCKYALPENPEDKNVNAVVVGLAPTRFNYESMTRAFNTILNNSAELVAIHKSRYFKTDDGELVLGPGPFVEALEYATDRKAIVVGKPEKRFFLQGLEMMGLGNDFPLDNAVMIGDDVRVDVGGAQAAGIKGILVKTGKYRAGDEKKIDPPPWAVCDSFVEAVEKIENEIIPLK